MCWCGWRGPTCPEIPLFLSRHTMPLETVATASSSAFCTNYSGFIPLLSPPRLFLWLETLAFSSHHVHRKVPLFTAFITMHLSQCDYIFKSRDMQQAPQNLSVNKRLEAWGSLAQTPRQSWETTPPSVVEGRGLPFPHMCPGVGAILSPLSFLFCAFLCPLLHLRATERSDSKYEGNKILFSWNLYLIPRWNTTIWH